MKRIFALCLVLALAGCSDVLNTLQDAVGPQPTASVTSVRLSDLDLSSITLNFDVAIENPYRFALPLVDLDYGLSTFSKPFLDGSTKLDGNVPANGSRTVSLPLRVEFASLIRTVSSIRPGQVVPYDAQLGLSVDVQGLGPQRIPLSKSGELPVPNAPSVEVRSFDWDQLSLTNVGGTLSLGVGNTNDFPLSLRSLDYDLGIAGRDVFSGQSDDALELPAGQSGELRLPLSFSPASAGTALLGILGGSEADYSIGGSLSVDTPFGPMTLPFDRRGTAKQGS